jgi:hypothetical protein
MFCVTLGMADANIVLKLFVKFTQVHALWWSPDPVRMLLHNKQNLIIDGIYDYDYDDWVKIVKLEIPLGASLFELPQICILYRIFVLYVFGIFKW